MPVKLFSLKGVPDDEAEEVRALLTKYAIDYYETPPGNWGVSMPAIWLNDDSQLARAKLLIEDYQCERTAQARAAYARLKAEGRYRTLVDALGDNPLKVLIYLCIAVALIYLSTKPFFGFGL